MKTLDELQALKIPTLTGTQVASLVLMITGFDEMCKNFTGKSSTIVGVGMIDENSAVIRAIASDGRLIDFDVFIGPQQRIMLLESKVIQ